LEHSRKSSLISGRHILLGDIWPDMKRAGFQDQDQIWQPIRCNPITHIQQECQTMLVMKQPKSTQKDHVMVSNSNITAELHKVRHIISRRQSSVVRKVRISGDAPDGRNKPLLALDVLGYHISIGTGKVSTRRGKYYGVHGASSAVG